MKRFGKVLSVLGTICLISAVTVSYAQTRKSALGPSVVHRNGVYSSDASSTLTTYASTIATAKAANLEPTTISKADHSVNTVFNASGYTHVKVFCDTFGSTNISVTPYYYEGSGSWFCPGTATSVTADKIYTVETDQSEYMFMFCTVTTGGMSIYLQGIEERGY